ncbi:PorV/PorQ family protein [Candidatus Neomarinimicrobiota bacterium]
MKLYRKTLNLLLAAIVLTGGLQADEVKKVAQTSMKWLALPVGARPVSMGSAYFCMLGSADNIFVNPAGTAYLERPHMSVTMLPWFADINQNSLALSVPLGNFGVFTGSFRQVDFGEQQGTILANTPEGWIYTDAFTPTALQVGLGYARRMSDRFSYGMHVSYARENLADIYYAPVLDGSKDDPEIDATQMGLVNLDFGVLYYTGFHDLRMGMTLKNFSEEQGYGNVGNPIPMDWRFGVAMDLLTLLPGESRTHKLTFAWDLSHPRDYSERLHFGLEYTFAELIALRAGYKTNYDEQNISFGAGLLPQRTLGSVTFGLDYAYLPFGILGDVQVFSFSLGF